MFKNLLLMSCLLAVFAGFANLSLIGFRVLQVQRSVTQSSKSPPDTYRRDMKAQVSQDQKQVLAYEREIHQLKKKLEETSSLNNPLQSSQTPSQPQSSQTQFQPVVAPQVTPSTVKSKSPAFSPPPRNYVKSFTPSSSQAEPSNQDLTISFANDIVYGLTIAHDKGQIKSGSHQYRKVQTAIKLLRRGKSLKEAAHQAHLPVSRLEELRELGKTRPGGSEQPLPPLISHSAQTEEDSQTISIYQANDVVYGLTMAQQKGQNKYKYGNRQYRKVQTVIKLLRQGESLEEAGQKSNVSLSDLKQLIEWGQQRPARRLNNHEITNTK